MLCFELVCAQTPHQGQLQYNTIASMREEPLSSGKGTQFLLKFLLTIGIHTQHGLNHINSMAHTLHKLMLPTLGRWGGHLRRTVSQIHEKKKKETNKELTGNYLSLLEKERGQ